MENFAIVIGIDNYLKAADGLAPLSAAVADAKAFAEWVGDPNGGNVKSEHVFSLFSPDDQHIPTQTEFEDKFGSFIEVLRKDRSPKGRFYFYFAGHGVANPDDDGENYLCMANWTKFYSNRALSMADGVSFLSFLGLFKEIIFMVDCCRTTFIRASRGFFGPPNISLGDAIGKNSLFVALAVPYGEKSNEAPAVNPETGLTENRGVFTEVLIEGLKGKASNAQGIVDHNSLTNYLKMHVPKRAQKKEIHQGAPDIDVKFSRDCSGPECTQIIFSSFDRNCNVTFTFRQTGEIKLVNSANALMETYQITQEFEKHSISLPVGVYSLIKEDLRNTEKFFRIEGNDQELPITY
jgi:Caspase domain